MDGAEIGWAIDEDEIRGGADEEAEEERNGGTVDECGAKS